jgi:hypothetical protein
MIIWQLIFAGAFCQFAECVHPQLKTFNDSIESDSEIGIIANSLSSFKKERTTYAGTAT